MITMMGLVCAGCREPFQKMAAEVKRQRRKGATRFFCGRKCAGRTINAERRAEKVQKTCPFCQKTFFSTTKARAATFCSKSCASAGSVTDYRRRRAKEISDTYFPAGRDVHRVAARLRKREAPKYRRAKEYLEANQRRYQFEYVLPSTTMIFDLALFDLNILVELDGPNHRICTQTARRDASRDRTAKDNGWKVVRISVPANTAMPVDKIKELYGDDVGTPTSVPDIQNHP